MAFLFTIQGKTVFPNTETLLIYPFKEIWERDKSKEKRLALQELTFIEFMCSMKKSNPYKGYSEEVRKERLMAEIIVEKNWKPDKLVNDGITKLKEFQTNASATYSYFVAVKRGMENLKDFFLNVDLGERNKSGMPVYKPTDITRAITDAEKTLSNLSALEKKVEEELFEETKTKGGKEISPFADPNNLR